MKESKRWVKIFPKMTDWCWYDDLNTRVTFIHLILTANYKDKGWHGITIKRGSRVISYAKLAEEVGISIQSIRTSLTRLKSTQEITQSSHNKYTVISINNYELYQESTQSLTNNQQTTNKQLTTTIEYIDNIRIIERESYDPIWGKEICSKYSVKESDVIELWEQMVNSRIANGKPYKDWKRGFIAWLLPSIKEGKIIKVISKKEKMIKEAQEVGFDLSIFNLPKENA